MALHFRLDHPRTCCHRCISLIIRVGRAIARGWWVGSSLRKGGGFPKTCALWYIAFIMISQQNFQALCHHLMSGPFLVGGVQHSGAWMGCHAGLTPTEISMVRAAGKLQLVYCMPLMLVYCSCNSWTVCRCESCALCGCKLWTACCCSDVIKWRDERCPAGGDSWGG